MSALGNGGPAFPVSWPEANEAAQACEDLANPNLDKAERVYTESLQSALMGMSLLDHFAGLSMRDAPAVAYDMATGYNFKQRAEWAYLQAKAMLAARSKS